MSMLSSLRRLRAFERDQPQPIGKYKNVHLASPDALMFVAFVRMGGESMPWGVAWQQGITGNLNRLWVPEPRDQAAVAAMLAEFTPALLTHLQHPRYVGLPASASARDSLTDRQVWVANPTHVAMLHNLALAYHGERMLSVGHQPVIGELARAANWLFHESQRPGQTTVIAATDALRVAFEYPAEPSRCGHLGFLLAWHSTPTSKTRREAALDAWGEPDDIGLSPAFERDHLRKPVDAYNAALKSGATARVASAKRKIGDLIKPALEHRVRLAIKAYELLRSDVRPFNPGLTDLVTASQAERWRDWLSREQDVNRRQFAPRPDTDHGAVSAAIRYQRWEAALERSTLALIHHDPELQADAIAEGEAIKGTVVAERVEGSELKTCLIWTLESPAAPKLRVRDGEMLCVASMPILTVRVRSIAPSQNQQVRFDVELTSHRLPVVPSWIGRTVVLVNVFHDNILQMKLKRLRDANVPGAWLTHDRGSADMEHETPEDDE